MLNKKKKTVTTDQILNDSAYMKHLKQIHGSKEENCWHWEERKTESLSVSIKFQLCS